MLLALGAIVGAFDAVPQFLRAQFRKRSAALVEDQSAVESSAARDVFRIGNVALPYGIKLVQSRGLPLTWVSRDVSADPGSVDVSES
jgi:hypothetical protein